ncbi:MAG: hypothetical protein WDZ88_03885 [Candidatus Paceibacterota bacterium]
MKEDTVEEINPQNGPLLLRRMRARPSVPNIVANMTVVTTQGNSPEMHDQVDDPTAPRRD